MHPFSKALAAGVAAAALCVISGQVMAQNNPIIYQPNPDSPIGTRNEKAPAETAQFDFVVGDWDAVITWTPPNKPPVTYKAKWHNHWIIDGYALMQEWRGPYLTGTEIRYFDAEQKKWLGQNLYVDGKWTAVTAEFSGGEMIVNNPEVNKGPKGEFISREVYFGIGPDNWQMKSEHSFDGGVTWGPGRYSMVSTRAK